jgi:hypothetical protein
VHPMWEEGELMMEECWKPLPSWGSWLPENKGTLEVGGFVTPTLRAFAKGGAPGGSFVEATDYLAIVTSFSAGMDLVSVLSRWRWSWTTRAGRRRIHWLREKSA